MSKSSLIGHPKCAEAEALRAEGKSYEHICKALDLPRGVVERYFRGRGAGRGATWEAPPLPDLTGDARGDARANAKWLRDSIAAALKAEVDPRALAPLAAQYTAALKHCARLEGALEVTAAQILRSTDFARILAALERIVGSDSEVWRKWREECGRLMGEGGGGG